MKKIQFKITYALIIMCLISCGSSDDTIEGTKPAAATKASFSGKVVLYENSNNITYDLDETNEDETFVKLENYANGYTYKLKLKGVYTKNTYEVAQKKVSDEKVYFNLSALNMKSDYYTAILVEIDSGNELELQNLSETEKRSIRFIDHGGTDFYTTIRASRVGGVISSTGHPQNESIQVVFVEFENAKALVDLGQCQLAFYSTDQTFLAKQTSYQNAGIKSTGLIGRYFLYATFFNPNRSGISSGNYLIRMEVIKDNKIIKSSPFQTFKVQ